MVHAVCLHYSSALPLFMDELVALGKKLTHAVSSHANQAPAILFVDEFDALGAARGAQSSGDESAAIINELLVRVAGHCGRTCSRRLNYKEK